MNRGTLVLASTSLLWALAACDAADPVADAVADVVAEDGADDGTPGDLPAGDPGPDGGADGTADAVPDVPPADLPADAADAAPDGCTPSCQGRQCGDDGCGGSCGTCPGLCGGTEPAPCHDGTCAMACCPWCGDRACGDDGCGGLCGACGDGQACDPVAGQCAPACDWATQKPASWGPAGQVLGPMCSADKTFNQARCHDFTGDGNGDNGMASMCNQVIATLLPVEPVPLPLVAVLEGVANVRSAAAFTLQMLPVAADVEPPLPAGDVLATLGGYDTATCQPLYAFPGARIEAGALSAGPADLDVRLVLAGGAPAMHLRVVQARLAGQVQAGGGAAGYAMEDGLFTGVVTKRSWENAVATMQAACDAAPEDARPDYCAYLKVVVSSIPALLDLHQEPDGTFAAKSPDKPADAGSLCWSFRLVPARVTGFAP